MINVILVLVPLLASVAYITIAERKVMASMQRRVGPNEVGVLGLLQPFSDALKLLVKELLIPVGSNKMIFLLAPLGVLILALLGWSAITLNKGLTISDMELGMLYILAISSLGSYGILFAGWSSNSKYSFLGSLRSTAQLISYEIILGLCVLTVVLLSGSLNVTSIIESQRGVWNIIPVLPLGVLFYIAALAEVSRVPFDLVEAESELVSGHTTEYASAPFVFFFLAEYANIILMSTITSILFLGGYLIPYDMSDGLIKDSLQSLSLGIKSGIIVFIFIWIRAALPRIRFDGLIRLCWQYLLPISLGMLSLVSSLVVII